MENLHDYYNVRRKIIVSLIAAGSTVISVIVNSSLMRFYISFVGFDSNLWAFVFIIFTIWNAINDPIIGYLSDKVKFIPGKGKYSRLVWWSIPTFVITVVPLFFVQVSWNQIFIAVYLLVLMTIYEAAQTLTNVSFNAFKINTFINMKKRSEFQMILTYVKLPTTFLAMLIPMWFLSGKYSLSTVSMIFTGSILFGIMLMIIGAIFMKEDQDFYTHDNNELSLGHLWKVFRQLSKNKSFIILVMAIFLMQFGTGNSTLGYTYYMYDVLQVGELKATIPDILTGVVQMLTFPFIIKYIGKKGSKKTFITGMIIACIGHFLLTFSFNYWIVSGIYIFILFGYGFYSIINEPLQGLIVDEIELKTGERNPASIAGIIQIFMVLAPGLSAAILSKVLHIVDYAPYVNGMRVNQTETVMQAIRYTTGLFPAILVFVAILIVRLLPIDKKREDEIQHLIKEKHNFE